MMDLKYTELHNDKFGITMRVKDVLYTGQSEFQKIDILDTEFFGRMLLLDGLVMTTEKDEFFYHEMIVHIPMLSHKNPEKVLVIGGGDGGTIREVLRHPSVKKAVLCEIDGEVINVCKKYLPTLSCALDDERVDIQVRDGIEFIANSKNEFDVILIDSTDPMGPGEGLFTEEFYKNVNAALKDGGIMVCQSESPLADQQEIKMMQPLLKKAFPLVKTYAGPMPTYPAGYWCWTFCSNGVEPQVVDEKRADEIAKNSKLYNKELHNAVFALPNFVKELVGAC